MKYKHRGCCPNCPLCRKSAELGWTQEQLDEALKGAQEFGLLWLRAGRTSMWPWVVLALFEFVVILCLAL